MSTWHQRRNPVRLWHEIKFTVVSDPPNELLTVARFDTLADAQAHLDAIRAHGEKNTYIISPQMRKP